MTPAPDQGRAVPGLAPAVPFHEVVAVLANAGKIPARDIEERAIAPLREAGQLVVEYDEPATLAHSLAVVLAYYGAAALGISAPAAALALAALPGRGLSAKAADGSWQHCQHAGLALAWGASNGLFGLALRQAVQEAALSAPTIRLLPVRIAADRGYVVATMDWVTSTSPKPARAWYAGVATGASGRGEIPALVLHELAISFGSGGIKVLADEAGLVAEAERLRSAASRRDRALDALREQAAEIRRLRSEGSA